MSLSRRYRVSIGRQRMRPLIDCTACSKWWWLETCLNRLLLQNRPKADLGIGSPHVRYFQSNFVDMTAITLRSAGLSLSEQKSPGRLPGLKFAGDQSEISNDQNGS